MTAPAGAPVRTALRNTGVLAVARVAERGSSLVVALLLSRHEGASGLGAYVTAIAYYQLIATGSELGLSTWLVREIAVDRARGARLVGRAMSTTGTVGAAATAVLLTAAPHLPYSPELRTCIALAALAVVPACFIAIEQAVFVAHQRVEIETIGTVATGAVTIAGSAWLLANGHGAVALTALFVASRLVLAVAYVATVASFARPRFRGPRSEIAGIGREIRPFAASSVVGALFARPEIVLLSFFASEAQVGRFSAAFKLVDLWQFLPQTFMVNVYPFLARAYRSGDGDVREIRQAATTALLAIGIPISVGLLLVAPAAMTAVFGEPFRSAAPLLQVLAPTVVLYCAHSVLWRSISARGDQAVVLRVQLVTVVARIAVAAALIAALDAFGAAVSVVVALALHNALLARKIDAREGRLVDLRRLAPYLGASLVMAAFVAAVRLPLLAAVVAAALVYATAAAAAVAVGATPRRA